MLINDVYRGSTPLIIERIEPGTYGVTFSRFGYAKLSTPLRVESGKTTEVSGALIPLTGSLDITTRPAGVRILLDAVNQGVTPVSLPDITVGNHTLTVVKEGYVTAEQRVTVVEGTNADQYLTCPRFTSPYGYVTSSRTCPCNPDCGFYHDSPGHPIFAERIVKSAKSLTITRL